jgi:hypothetical protein
MTNWSSKHRMLALAALLYAVLAAGLYLYVIRPQSQRVERLEQRAVNEAEALRQRNWPVDSDRLQAIMSRKQKELEQLRSLTKTILELATSAFDERIGERFENKANFMNHVTRLDYQEYFSQIEQNLGQRDIVLEKQVLNLSETSAAANVYQSVLQLWTVERVLNVALAHNLVPVKIPVTVDIAEGAGTPAGLAVDAVTPPRSETRYVSNVSVQTVREYFLDPAAESPYVLELPVTMTVRCTTKDLLGFLEAVSSRDTFTAVNLIQVRKTPPFQNQSTPDLLRVDIECSTFFRPDTAAASIRAPATLERLPPGA